jgi:AcrR family transcriptional regulator
MRLDGLVKGVAMNPNDTRRRPLQKRSIEKVEAILDAVERLVVVHGSESLTTTLVAEETGFAVGTIYQYFGNSADLLIAAHDRMLGRLAMGVSRAAAGVDITEDSSVDKLIRLFVENARAYPGYISLLDFSYVNKTSRHTDVMADDFIGELVSYFVSTWVPNINPTDLLVARTVNVNILTILTNVLLLEDDAALQERYLREMIDHSKFALERAAARAGIKRTGDQ